MNLTHTRGPAKNALILPVPARSAFNCRYTLDIRLITVIGLSAY